MNSILIIFFIFSFSEFSLTRVVAYEEDVTDAKKLDDPNDPAERALFNNIFSNGDAYPTNTIVDTSKLAHIPQNNIRSYYPYTTYRRFLSPIPSLPFQEHLPQFNMMQPQQPSFLSIGSILSFVKYAWEWIQTILRLITGGLSGLSSVSQMFG